MAKRKSKTNQFECPSCNQLQYNSSMDTSLKLYSTYHKKNYPNLKFTPKELLSSFQYKDLIWACDDCFENKKAIPSVPEKMYNSGSPHLVYFDSSSKCQRCDEDFIFSKKEKQFWYEGLGFHTDSFPVNCMDCRKIVRKEKNDNTRLSELLKNKETLSKEQLLEVADIYSRMGKEERMKMYQTFASKK